MKKATFTEKELTIIVNKITRKMNKITARHFDESKYDCWDSDAAFEEYNAYSESRVLLMSLMRKKGIEI